MKIKKMYSGVVPNGKVLNTKNNSQQDTYSSDYLNRAIPNTKDLGEIVVDDITCKNIFDKNNFNKLNSYIASTTGLITADASNRLLYVECKPNTTYTIQKLSSAAFGVAYTNEVPTNGVQAYGFKNGGSSTELTITTGSEAKYIVFRYYHTINDTTYTEQQILDSIQIEKGSVATDYVEHKEFENKEIYSTNEIKIGTWLGKPLYRKVLTATTPSTEMNATNLFSFDSYIDLIIDYKVFIVTSGNIKKLGAGTEAWVRRVDKTIAASNNNSSYYSSPAYCIIEYTKKTD